MESIERVPLAQNYNFDAPQKKPTGEDNSAGATLCNGEKGRCVISFG